MMAVVFIGLILLAFEFEVEQQPVPQPETIGTVYYFDSQTNSLRPLERQIAMVKWKRNLETIFGITGAETAAELKETNSPFRIRQGEKLEFLVRLPAGVDPGKFQLFSWSIKSQKGWTMGSPQEGQVSGMMALVLLVDRTASSINCVYRFSAPAIICLIPGSAAVFAICRSLPSSNAWISGYRLVKVESLSASIMALTAASV